MAGGCRPKVKSTFIRGWKPRRSSRWPSSQFKPNCLLTFGCHSESVACRPGADMDVFVAVGKGDTKKVDALFTARHGPTP